MLSGGSVHNGNASVSSLPALGITSESSAMLGVTSEPLRLDHIKGWTLCHILSLLNTCRVVSSKKQLLIGTIRESERLEQVQESLVQGLE